MGDFNCIFHDVERSSNTGASSSFQNWTGERGLLDIGFIGNRYTWIRGISLETRRTARLDRALCFHAWRRMFSSTTVRHLSHTHLDHCPFLLVLNRMRMRHLGWRLFRIQAVWLLHE